MVIKDEEIEDSIENSEFFLEEKFFSFMKLSFKEVEKMINIFLKFDFLSKKPKLSFIERSSICLSDIEKIEKFFLLSNKKKDKKVDKIREKFEDFFLYKKDDC